MIKLAIFDMAGTTVVDSGTVAKCFLTAAKSTGLSVNRKQINAVQGLPKRLAIETLWKLQDGTSEALSENIENTFVHFKDLLERQYLTLDPQPTVGALQTFRWLARRKIKIALTTGFYRRVCDIILHKLGWDLGLDQNHMGNEASIIDLSLTPDETGRGRPHPDMIFTAMKVFGIQTGDEVIKVGDTPSDIQAGKAAGCFLTIAVSNGTHSHDELAAYQPDILLPSLESLPRQLTKYF